MFVVHHQYRINYLESKLKSRDNYVIQVNNQRPEAADGDLEGIEFTTNTASKIFRNLPKDRRNRVEQNKYQESGGDRRVLLPNLSRHARSMQSKQCNINMSSVLQKYCDGRDKRKNPVKEYVTLSSASYEASFYILFPYNSSANGPIEYMESFPSNLPSRVMVYKDNRITFYNAGSPLGIYRSVNETVNNTLVELVNTSGKFIVKTSGTYIVHVNITLVDETSHHSIGLFQNDQLMLACPRGGIVCTSNHADSTQYRICNIAGILKLRTDDVIQLRTMMPNTTVRLQKRQKSVFFISLLAQDL
ncbi:hypothetical protein Btru_039188 [Bulinus truncatus]|nr:hypothetical protein Btru_039188 [Bulinus truncatus]